MRYHVANVAEQRSENFVTSGLGGACCAMRARRFSMCLQVPSQRVEVETAGVNSVTSLQCLAAERRLLRHRF